MLLWLLSSPVSLTYCLIPWPLSFSVSLTCCLRTTCKRLPTRGTPILLHFSTPSRSRSCTASMSSLANSQASAAPWYSQGEASSSSYVYPEPAIDPRLASPEVIESDVQDSNRGTLPRGIETQTIKNQQYLVWPTAGEDEESLERLRRSFIDWHATTNWPTHAQGRRMDARPFKLKSKHSADEWAMFQPLAAFDSGKPKMQCTICNSIISHPAKHNGATSGLKRHVTSAACQAQRAQPQAGPNDIVASFKKGRPKASPFHFLTPISHVRTNTSPSRSYPLSYSKPPARASSPTMHSSTGSPTSSVGSGCLSVRSTRPSSRTSSICSRTMHHLASLVARQ